MSFFDQRDAIWPCSLTHRRAVFRVFSLALSACCPMEGLPLSEPELCFASTKINSHPCIKCQAPMVLTPVSTARLAFDVRTFECFNCDHVDKVIVETKRGSTDFPFAHL